MSTLRQAVMSALPGPLRRALKAVKKWYLDRVADRLYFPVWLVWQSLRHRQPVVMLHRINALGDVLCTLPMVAEIRRRHPGRPVVFVVAAPYRKMLLLARGLDAVYGARCWTFTPPGRALGLIEKVYSPKNTDELNPQAGAPVHLVDDLAASCGLPLTQRQPRLFPPPELIQRTLTVHGLSPELARGRRLFAINCGHTWPVRMWSAANWQTLVDRLHAEYDCVILQFGLHLPGVAEDEFTRLRGVKCLVSRLPTDELVALVARCELLISIDSGPVHIAGTVGTPVVGLFGAVNPQFRLPPESPGCGIYAPVPCLFCHHTHPLGHWQTGCPHDIRCMKELDVETVFQAVKTILKNKHLKSEAV